MVALVLAFAAPSPAVAAPKKKPAKTSGSVKNDKEERPPAPDDRGTNEGGAGRKNATEDAARAAESPTTITSRVNVNVNVHVNVNVNDRVT